MKVGDLVRYRRRTEAITKFEEGVGIIVGFGEKGSGGKEYIHILKKNGNIDIFMQFQVEKIDRRSE